MKVPKKILVTGASGFVGTWLTKKLIEEEQNIVVLARHTSDLSDIGSSAYERAEGDVTNYESVESACREVDVVYHLAGYIGYKASERKIMESVNVQGTKNIIEACKKNKVRRLIHLSSVVAIGASSKKNILDENAVYNLASYHLGYPDTKKRAEELVQEACRKNEVDAVILNPSTIYGPGDAKKGSRAVQLKVAKGKFPFYTAGGVSVVSVHDVVKATLQAESRGGTGERYILSGENVSIHQLFSLVAKAAGVSAPHIYLPTPLVRGLGVVGDLMERMGKKGPVNSESAVLSTFFHWYDNSKAKSDLGLAVTSAKDCIHLSIEWAKQRGYLHDKKI